MSFAETAWPAGTVPYPAAGGAGGLCGASSAEHLLCVCASAAAGAEAGPTDPPDARHHVTDLPQMHAYVTELQVGPQLTPALAPRTRRYCVVVLFPRHDVSVLVEALVAQPTVETLEGVLLYTALMFEGGCEP